ncbi:MAG: tetratricopeptide repeat protein [Planctomycetota bacterium]|nr:MAG: tetratricopeptide repeat protein [Planctomycetota bacterium]
MGDPARVRAAGVRKRRRAPVCDRPGRHSCRIPGGSIAMRSLIPSLGPGRRSPAGLPYVAVALLVLWGLGCPAARAQSADEVRQAWREGVALFEQGQYDEALKRFEKVLAANPSNELALELRNEAGYQLFVEMLGREDDLATVARKVLELAEVGQLRQRQSPERIRALLRTMYDDESFEKSYRAMEELASQVGPFCVPYVVDTLADRQDDERRAKAIVLLSKLGPDGTNAVIELLYHPDDFVRQNACAILGHLGDIKAVPYLRAVTEWRDESPHVRRQAESALREITGKDASSLGPAVVYFEALAERYYQEHPSVMVNNFRDWAVWGWRNGKLVPRLVPRYAYNEEMAEKVCYDALRHGARAGVETSALDGVWTILVSTLFQEKVEVDALLEALSDPARAAKVDSQRLAELRARKATVANQPALAVSRGEAYLGKALRKALLDGRPLLAVALIEHMRDLPIDESLLPAPGADLAAYLREGATPTSSLEIGSGAARSEQPVSERRVVPRPAAQPRPSAEPATEPAAPSEPAPAAPRRRRRRISARPLDALDGLAYGPVMQRTLEAGSAAHAASLAAALVYRDKRVRYAAAEALVRLAPTREFAAAQKVVENLSSALGESGSRVVLIVARDTQVRNRLAGIVRDLGYLPVPVPSAKQGLMRARSNPVQDAILIHTELNPDGLGDDLRAEQFIAQIRRDYRTAGVPIFVLTPANKVAERAGLFPEAKAVLADNVDPVVLAGHFEKLWNGAKDPKGKAVAIARKAAKAIAEADPRRSVFDLRKTIPALLDAVERQPDDVRVPALRALGVLRAREAVDVATVVFETNRRLTVRTAAAFCLGEALRGQALPDKVFAAFTKAVQGGQPNARLYRACSEALAKTRLTDAQRLRWFELGRVD